MTGPVPLADFDPAVARAVVAVLRRAGLPAGLVGDEGDADARRGEELTVVVPEARREEALVALAAAMDDVQEELRRGDAVPAPRVGTPAHDGGAEDDEAGPPLLFERLRRLGFLPVLLVPLLVVTLAQVRMPAAYTIALLVGGAAAVVAWRDGRRRRS